MAELPVVLLFLTNIAEAPSALSEENLALLPVPVTSNLKLPLATAPIPTFVPTLKVVSEELILAAVTALFAIVRAVSPVTSPVCVALVTLAVLAVTAELLATSVSKSVMLEAV